MNQEEIDAIIDDIRDGMLCAWSEFGWIKGNYGNDQQGYCLVGAWNRATQSDSALYLIFEKCAKDIIRDMFPGRPNSIVSFNDSENSSEEDVRLLTKHAFERMKDVLPELISPSVAPMAMDAPAE